MRDPRDQEWLAKLRTGDERALVSFIHIYSEPLRNYLVLTVHSYDIAEDIVQSLWIWLWENRTSLPSITNVKSYLYRAARNRALNAVRDRRTYDRMVGDAIQGSEIALAHNTGVSRAEAASTRDVLNAVIAEFRPPMREICMLRFEQDLTYSEIAEVLGIAEVNVRMAVSRATRRLIERLKEVL